MRELIQITYDDNLQLEVRPHDTHEWLIETALVAKGYDVDKQVVKKHLVRNASEFVENKHFVRWVQNVPSNEPQIFWTKKGVIRLGFFIKSERAKRFRDWAEDLIVKQVESNTPPQYSPNPVTLPNNYIEALEALLQSEKEKERQKSVIEVLAPKAEYTDKVLQAKNSWTITTIASELGMSAQKLNAELYKRGVQRFHDGSWILYADYANRGFTETRTYAYNTDKGEVRTKIYTTWTELGRMFIHSLFDSSIGLSILDL